LRISSNTLLSGRVAIVTGASSGIGRAIARELAAAGCRTVLAARSTEALESLQETIVHEGGEAHAAPTNLLAINELEALVRTTVEKYRGLDFLINNAGWGRKAPVSRGKIEDWENTFRVNLLAPMILAKLVLPMLTDQKRGAIVNVSSISGRAGQAGSAAYAASKAGLIAFSQSLYEEVREHGIKVAAILPGFVDTPMIPPVRGLDRSRMIRPEDVAQAVAFVLRAPATSCPVEITLRPQRTPYK
jgi:NAD(P)-dependent dehydrogenase (short-subunit alcohol dehydrogenase family)